MTKKLRDLNGRAAKGQTTLKLSPAEVRKLMKASAAAANELGREARAAFGLSEASARLRLQ